MSVTRRSPLGGFWTTSEICASPFADIDAARINVRFKPDVVALRWFWPFAAFLWIAGNHSDPNHELPEANGNSHCALNPAGGPQFSLELLERALLLLLRQVRIRAHHLHLGLDERTLCLLVAGRLMAETLRSAVGDLATAGRWRTFAATAFLPWFAALSCLAPREAAVPDQQRLQAPAVRDGAALVLSIPMGRTIATSSPAWWCAALLAEFPSAVEAVQAWLKQNRSPQTIALGRSASPTAWVS